MENHPIPQDITGFQFKLIGNMTVKQFSYLAISVVIGWFLFASHITFIIKYPLALLSVGLGVSLAFLPFEGRPLDMMIINFIKAFFAPTQYVYQKTGGSLELTGTRSRQAKDAGDKAHNPPPSQLEKDLSHKEHVFTESVSSLYQPRVMAPHDLPLPSPKTETNQRPPKADVTIQPATPHVDVAPPREEEHRQHKAQAHIEPPKTEKALESHTKAPAIQTQTSPAVTTSQPVPTPKVAATTPPTSTQAVAPTQATAAPAPEQTPTTPLPTTTQEAPREVLKSRQIPTSMATNAGIPVTPETPNLITGIVKDPRGNSIPNILVEVKDSEKNPVRAFKTNGLGQFASATPLPDGIYTIDFEDLRGANKFETVSFEARGEIILPFEVISTDKREELRRELFN